ncbi:hypothetical protein D3Z38_05130 [Clostridiales bacterium]|nr:hypothetical protein [Clostridiales bacterium]
MLLAALLAAILSTFAMTSLTTATIWTHDIYKGYILIRMLMKRSWQTSHES